VTLLSTVASDAAATRATVFTLFVPVTNFSADRRSMSTNPTADRDIHLMPLETLAAMTGGGSYRIDVGAESTFDRLSRELGGYYRIGVEKNATDLDGKPVAGLESGVQICQPKCYGEGTDCYQFTSDVLSFR
jgi:hypothetical protein